MKKKRNVVGALGKTAVALTLISTCLVGGTLAKYTSEVTGTGNAIAAKWNVAFKSGDNAESATQTQTTDFNFADLKDTRINANSLVKEGKIAPGSTGVFAVEIDGTDTEVAYDYKITLTTTLNSVPIKFYSDKSMQTEISSGTPLTGTIAVDAASKKTSQPIYWKWVTASTDGDTSDTNVGKDLDANRKGTFTVKLEATQKQ